MDVKDVLLATAASVNLACYANVWEQKNNALLVAIHPDPENNFVLGHSYVVFRDMWRYVVLHTKGIENPYDLEEITIPFAEMSHLTKESESYEILASVIGEHTLNGLITQEKAIEDYVDIARKAALN